MNALLWSFEILNFSDLGEESMQIPIIQVTLLSEQHLTINLINEYGEDIFLLIYTYRIFQEMLHMSIWRIESVVSHWYPSSTHSCNKTSIKSGSRTTHLYVYIWALLEEWVNKQQLPMGKWFRNKWLDWLVFEMQHPPIYIQIQAVACRRGWLQYKGGLSSEFIFHTIISLAQT